MQVTRTEMAFISIILSLPDNFRAGKTVAAFIILLGIWYGARERKRFAGPAFLAAEQGKAQSN